MEDNAQPDAALEATPQPAVADPSPAQTQPDAIPANGGDTPDDKSPIPYSRFQEVVQERNELRSEIKSLSERMGQFEQTIKSQQTKPETEEMDYTAVVDEYFQNDPEGKAQFNRMYKPLREAIFREANDIQSRLEKEQEQRQAEEARQRQEQDAAADKLYQEVRERFPSDGEFAEFSKFVENQLETFPKYNDLVLKGEIDLNDFYLLYEKSAKPATPAKPKAPVGSPTKSGQPAKANAVINPREDIRSATQRAAAARGLI